MSEGGPATTGPRNRRSWGRSCALGVLQNPWSGRRTPGAWRNHNGGGGKPPAAAASAVAPIARQYRNLATELWSEVAMRATSSMAACASFIALVVDLVATATASMFSAI